MPERASVQAMPAPQPVAAHAPDWVGRVTLSSASESVQMSRSDEGHVTACKRRLRISCCLLFRFCRIVVIDVLDGVMAGCCRIGVTGSRGAALQWLSALACWSSWMHNYNDEKS